MTQAMSEEVKEDGKTVMLQLLYQESRRRLDLQLQNLQSLRTRAGALLSAAAVATSLLAGFAANAETNGKSLHLGAAGKFALGCFAVAIVVTLALFRNLPGLKFTVPGSRSSAADPVDGVQDLLKNVGTMPIVTSADAYRELATRLEALYETNEKTMEWVFAGMWLLAAAVGLELFAWMYVLTH